MSVLRPATRWWERLYNAFVGFDHDDALEFLRVLDEASEPLLCMDIIRTIRRPVSSRHLLMNLLEEEGFVTSEFESLPHQEPQILARRLYSITARGRVALMSARRASTTTYR